MTPETTLALCQAFRDRAHLAGAEWVIARKEAEANITYPAIAAALTACAAEARRRYFQELSALDLITGHTPSPFAELG